MAYTVKAIQAINKAQEALAEMADEVDPQEVNKKATFAGVADALGQLQRYLHTQEGEGYQKAVIPKVSIHKAVKGKPKKGSLGAGRNSGPK